MAIKTARFRQVGLSVQLAAGRGCGGMTHEPINGRMTAAHPGHGMRHQPKIW
jgi:hypothetical protein